MLPNDLLSEAEGMGQTYSQAKATANSLNASKPPKEGMGQTYSQAKATANSLNASKSPKGKEKLEKTDAGSVANGPGTIENLNKFGVVREQKEDGQNKPHRYEDIMKEADKSFSEEKIRDGIFLKNRRMKYWVEVKTGYNCFMLFARELYICHVENERYWRWSSTKDNSDAEIEVARLLDVCWLEISGRFNTSYLNPKVTYEVMFLVMLEPGYGWTVPMKLTLKLPNGNVQQSEEILKGRPMWQWTELRAGEFVVNPEEAGEVEFTLCEVEGGHWKRGLVVKGVIIRPKN